MHNWEVISWMPKKCLIREINSVFIAKEEFFKEVNLNGYLKDKQYLISKEYREKYYKQGKLQGV